MNWPLIVFLIGFVLMFVLRIPIAFGMMLTSVAYFLVKGLSLMLVAEKILTNLFSSYIIIAVPLFVFTANVMNTGKVTEMVFRFANVLVGNVRGGLGHVNVLASLIFSGMTGSAVADASGLGIMEIDAMRKHGYDDGFSCAITAASATIGPIFPPSIPMIFYSMLSGASIGKLFMGGMLPGVLIAIALMLYIAYIAKRRNYPRGEKYTLREFLMNTLKALPALLTPVILLAGIYTGVMTPTEAGAVAAFYAILISVFVYRAMGAKELWQAVVDTVRTAGVLAIIVGAAYTFSYIIALEHIPDMVAGVLLSMAPNKYVFLFLANVLFLVLGCFLDTSAIMLVFVPIVLPTVNALGIDLVHFGVLIVLNMMIGLSTPPYGVLLFIVSGISGTPLRIIIKEILPMIVAMLVVLAILTYFPPSILFIPNLFGQ